MALNSDLNMDFARLEQGRHELEFHLDNAFFEALDQDSILSGDVVAKCAIQAGTDTFRLHLSFEGNVEVTCDRCLDPVSEPIQGEDDILFKLAAEDGEDDNCVYLCAEHPVYDLGWLLFEEISVSLPIVCCHQPGECNPEMEKLLQAHLCTTVDDEE